MNEITYMVIEGTHKNPNDKSTIIKKTKKIYGPFNKKKAVTLLRQVLHN